MLYTFTRSEQESLSGNTHLCGSFRGGLGRGRHQRPRFGHQGGEQAREEWDGWLLRGARPQQCRASALQCTMRERLPSRFQAIVRLRCPRCLDGAVFASILKLHADCPSCGLKYEREPGYFLGAMYFSYAMALVMAVPLAVVLIVLWGFSPHQCMLAVAVVGSLMAPLLIRYSRVIWMHFDQLLDPR